MGEQVSQILSTMARVISWRDRGIIDDARFQSESLSELLSALEGHDPEFGEAVNLLVKRHDLAVKHFQAIAWLTRRAIHEDLLTPLGVSSPLHKVRDAIVEHVRDAIVGTGERELAVRLVTGLPPDWCTQELLKFAATVRLSLRPHGVAWTWTCSRSPSTMRGRPAHSRCWSNRTLEARSLPQWICSRPPTSTRSCPPAPTRRFVRGYSATRATDRLRASPRSPCGSQSSPGIAMQRTSLGRLRGATIFSHNIRQSWD